MGVYWYTYTDICSLESRLKAPLVQVGRQISLPSMPGQSRISQSHILSADLYVQPNFYPDDMPVSMMWRTIYRPHWLVCTTRSENITSRGRIGINSALQATPLVDPWFVDPVDKSAMISVLNDIVAGVGNGESLPPSCWKGCLWRDDSSESNADSAEQSNDRGLWWALDSWCCTGFNASHFQWTPITRYYFWNIMSTKLKCAQGITELRPLGRSQQDWPISIWICGQY